MDAYEQKQALLKHIAVGTQRTPLVPAERNNAVTNRRPQTREISSRPKSPSSAARSSPWRCPSPTFTRASSAPASQWLPKRPHSAERKRPSTPPSPLAPSTPVHESSVDVQFPSRKAAGGWMQESLWPSTMRSLNVSFQSDTIAIPVSKKEKPVSFSSDRTLRPTSNVAKRQLETPSSRKPTPERRRSPLKGKNNASDQSENSKPVDSLNPRLKDQHRWPSRKGGKVSFSAGNRNFDLPDKNTGMLNSSVHGRGLSPMRRLSEEGTKPLQKSSTDAVRLLSFVESSRMGDEAKSLDDCSLRILRPQLNTSLDPAEKIRLANSAAKSQSLQIPGFCPPPPIKTPLPISSRAVSPCRRRPSTPSSRAVSPCRRRPSTPSSRAVSPSRPRPSTPPARWVSPSRLSPIDSSDQSPSSVSVLSFVSDFKKGKKGAALMEDAHQMRLLYNRYLQWRFANARAEDVLYIQKAATERILYNVWNATLALWNSVVGKRINLQQLKLELKLNYVLHDQMGYLDDWALLEINHVNALSGAVEDLEANTVRLPVTGGAKANIEQLKVAICSAVDVMQAMGSTICSLLSRVNGINNLVSELAAIASYERAMLDECEGLLASAAYMQVEENSLRTRLMQFKQALGGG